MRFKVWLNWFKSQNITFKWFLVLILIRPITDALYWLKEISPFLSPLYIIGIGTPVLILFSFLSKRFPRKIGRAPNWIFNAWAVIVLVNLFILVAGEPTMDLIGLVLKLVLPIFLFAYLRRQINSISDLKGVLMTFLYASIIPALMLIYELTFNPIIGQEITSTRGGGTRLHGGYADIMIYAIHLLGAFMITAYFYLQNSKVNGGFRVSTIWMLLITLICLVAAFSIKHTATWGVILSLIVLFLYFTLSKKRGLLFAFIILTVGAFAFPKVYEKSIEPLLSKEIAVVEGRANVDKSFNGRMSRWKKYFGYWEEMPLHANLFGVSLSGEDVAETMVGGGMHSDYIRLLFLSGVTGLVSYLIFLTGFFSKIRALRKPERFLALASLGILMLLSITVNPLMYQSILYLLFPVLAFLSLPRKYLKHQYAQS